MTFSKSINIKYTYHHKGTKFNIKTIIKLLIFSFDNEFITLLIYFQCFSAERLFQFSVEVMMTLSYK